MPTTELFDVDVKTVGLVKRGANKKRYFLMKGQDTMETQDQALELLNELEKEEEPTLSSWQKLIGLLKSAIKPVKEETVDKDEDDLETRLETLEKAQKAEISKMAAELAETKAQLEKADAGSKAAEKRVSDLEKASGITQQAELAKMAGGKLTAEDLYEIQKSDPDRYGKIAEMLRAHDAQLREAGLWKEFGSSLSGEGDPTTKLQSRAETIAKEKNVPLAAAYQLAAREMPDVYASISKAAVEGKAQ